MIRYILVDDDPNILARVKSKLEAISQDYGLKHIASYHSSLKASQEIDVDSYDLLIVDFEMPVYNGIELAQKIAQDKKIVFLTSTTNNAELVINSLDVSGYLNKPFDIDEFILILKNRILGKIEQQNSKLEKQHLTLPIGKLKEIRINPFDVFYITTALIPKGITEKERNAEKPQKNCVHFFGANDKILFEDVRINIKDVDTQLRPYGFVKISQQTIVNLNHVKEKNHLNLHLYRTCHGFEISTKEKDKVTDMINQHRG